MQELLEVSKTGISHTMSNVTAMPAKIHTVNNSTPPHVYRNFETSEGISRAIVLVQTKKQLRIISDVRSGMVSDMNPFIHGKHLEIC